MINKEFSKLTDETKNLFEIVAAYFVHLYFNDLYERAQDSSSIDGGSITDMYKCMVRKYNVSMINNEKNFTNSLNNLHNFYNRHSSGAATFIDVNKFMEKFVASFVPIDFYKSLTIQKKNKLIHSVLMSVISHLTIETLQQISKIIDTRTKDDARYFQDEVINVLITERGNLYNKFVLQTDSGNRGVGRVVATNAKVIGENVELKQRNKHLVDIAKQYKSTLAKREGQIKKLIEISKKQKQQILELMLNKQSPPSVKQPPEIKLEPHIQSPKIEPSVSIQQPEIKPRRRHKISETKLKSQPEVKSESKPEVQSDTKSEVKSESKLEDKTETQSEVKSETKSATQSEIQPENGQNSDEQINITNQGTNLRDILNSNFDELDYSDDDYSTQLINNINNLH